MKNYQELVVWQKSHTLVLKIYAVTHTFPHTEIFGLTSQIRRTAISIPSNIAEGAGLRSDTDFRRFLLIAAGSATELGYHLILSKERHYLTAVTFDELYPIITEIRKMLIRLINTLGTTNS